MRSHPGEKRNRVMPDGRVNDQGEGVTSKASHGLVLCQDDASPPVRDRSRIERRGLPVPPKGTVHRRRLAQGLNETANAAITVIQAPSGSGKTIGVAAWATELTTADAVVWLEADALAHDVDRFWRRLRSELAASGAGSVPPLPPGDSDDVVWSGWISSAARALAEAHRRWLLVLDDFPVGSSSRLGDHLVWLASRSLGSVRVVLTASGRPAIDLPTVELDGACAHIGPELLVMDEQDVAAVLAAHGVRATPEPTSFVTAHTHGWARGVGIAARLLGSAAADRGPTSANLAATAEDPLANLDRAIDNLIDREVLLALPAAQRELVIRTSVATDVTPQLAQAMLGSDQPPTAPLVEFYKGFLDRRHDGSFRCHPLLRRSARRRLDTDWPMLARSSRRAAAEWCLANAADAEGIALAADVDDPAWLARSLVASLAVPLIAFDQVETRPFDPRRWAEVARTEPLISAATAIARGDLTDAEAMLNQLRSATEDDQPDPDPARQLTTAMIGMAIAGQQTDHARGLAAVQTCRELLALIGPTAARTAQLGAILDFHQAAFLAGSGEPGTALAVLAKATHETAAVLAKQGAVADGVGFAAWLHALQGNLTVAARHAAAVLTARPADRDESGVGYAQLATAWVHLERRELDQAQQRLHHATAGRTRQHDPWLAAARSLTQARLATASGDPDVALRLLAATPRQTSATTSGWLADRLTLAQAEAYLMVGEHQRALATLTPEPPHALVEARALAAAARRAVGDRRGAQALLTAVVGQLAAAPLPAVVQIWTLSAQLAAEAGDESQARSLLDRALRAADRETLRLSLSTFGPWVSAYVGRDLELRRRYRALVRSIRGVQEPAVAVPMGSTQSPAEAFSPLSERELQVLERLAQLSTTEEIAAELYVSPNTVKSHIKSLFQKLAVNRRSDAVRQARQLGLC